MNDRELRAAAVGIITYCSIAQTGQVPMLDEEEQMVETSAFLDNAIFDKALEICSYADLDDIQLEEAEE